MPHQKSTWKKFIYLDKNIFDNGESLIQFGEHNYTYDPANRLIKYKHYNNDGIIDREYEYWYDVDGERIGKCRRVLSENETEEFVFYLRDEEGNVMTEFKSNFCPAEQTPFLSQSAFKAKENNFYFGGRLVSTEKTDGYQLSCPIWHFYHSDHLGTPRVITDEGGEITAIHKYYPYGEEITSQTQNTLNHKFTGHERDFESNLDYMHARYYHQFMGRFLSVDPVKFADTGTQEVWNKYAYSLNNPAVYLDKNGKETKVFIVEQGKNFFELAGHFAMYVTSDGKSAGISIGGVQSDIRPPSKFNEKAFRNYYLKEEKIPELIVMPPPKETTNKQTEEKKDEEEKNEK